MIKTDILRRTKVLLLIATILIIPTTAWGQITQKGIVKLYNSNNQPLDGVQIMAIGSPPTNSDVGGNFQLELPNYQAGESLIISEISKNGYEIVNDDLIMYGWTLSEKRNVPIVMAKEGTIEDMRAMYYQVGMKKWNNEYQIAAEQLKQQYIANTITDEKRLNEMSILAAELSKKRKITEQFSEKIARINKDDIEPIELEVMASIEKGDIDGAIEIYRNSSILQEAVKQWDTNIQAITNRDELIPMMYRYADVCLFSAEVGDMEKARLIYEKIALSDTLNYDYAFDYAELLLDLSDDRAMDWWLKCGKITKNDNQLALVYSSIILLNNDSVYVYMDKFSDLISDENYTELIEPVIDFFLSTADYALNAIALKTGDFDKLEKTLKSRIAKLERTSNKNASQYFELTANYSHLYAVCIIRKQFDKALNCISKSYKHSLSNPHSDDGIKEAEEISYLSGMSSINIMMGKNDTAMSYAKQVLEKLEDYRSILGLKFYSSSLRSTNLEIANIYADQGRYEDAIAIYKTHDGPDTFLAMSYAAIGKTNEAYNHTKQAYHSAQEAYKLDEITNVGEMAESAFNYATILYTQNKMQEAKTIYEQALHIYEVHAGNEYLFESTHASILHNLGNIYYTTQQYQMAKSLYTRAVKIKEELLENEFATIVDKCSYASTTVNLANIYLEEKKPKMALENLYKSFSIYKENVDYNVVLLAPNMLINIINIIAAYYMLEDYSSCEKYINLLDQYIVSCMAINKDVFKRYEIASYLYKGEFYNKTDRSKIGKPLIKKAYSDAGESISTDGVLSHVFKEYEKGELLESR